MKNTHRRHDISDRTWRILEPLLPGRKGSGAELQKTVDCSLTLFFGFFEQEPHGETSPQIMEIERIPPDVFVVRETKEPGKIYWNSWLQIPITNGS